MNNFKRIIAFSFSIVLIFLLHSFIPIHKYYLSLTEVNVNTEKHTLDISSKLFIDDLELELGNATNKKIDLSLSIKNKEVETLLFNYLSRNFKINVGGKLQKLEFVGYEIENDAVWCYLEVAHFKAKGTVSILNTLLYEGFPEQSNLIHITWDGASKTAKLINPEKFAEFIFL